MSVITYFHTHFDLDCEPKLSVSNVSVSCELGH
ncbi:unnamed protein product [Acanthoscelides obtectus]|uniref:Uncharacterized protein n=1 Tax=Acanthoscelides obtectus TaxID=200917 RepID=A0A9P0MCF8_ACAOB|nr:unnamed protein product [Acanthoscelides obtectus]CAK1645928.1 hypothetical protein AOBTE_LOCUS14345 [Acanthoscelides obtectus]